VPQEAQLHWPCGQVQVPEVVQPQLPDEGQEQVDVSGILGDLSRMCRERGNIDELWWCWFALR